MPLAAPVRNPHLAEECDDDFCPRLPCRMFKEGFRRGYESGDRRWYALRGTRKAPRPGSDRL